MLVANNLSFLAEKFELLPANRFRGRSGRNTTDALHVLTSSVKNAWCSGKVAAALFLDIQGAFPNTYKNQLLHNMKCWKIPSCYIKLIDKMLSGRKTRLHFDNFISKPINIQNGTTQGCPLSMILYTFYNAPLILVANEKNKTALGFVNDSMFLAIANNLTDTHKTLKMMMERTNRGFEWSHTHNSPFEPNKLALMNFPRSSADIIPGDLTLIRTHTDAPTLYITVKTMHKYKYLGVILELNLRWTLHHQKVVANAAWWTHQVTRLSKISGGLSPKHMRQLYNTVAIPTFTYAADIWYTVPHISPSGSKQLGSVALSKKLTSIQQSAAKLITGALKSTAGDVLEAHANLLLIDLLISKIIFRAATRLSSLPQTHPLFKLIHRAAKRHVLRHRSPLHHIFHITNIIPNSIETITPICQRHNFKPKFTTTILKDKDKALTAANNLHNTKYTIYCNGSSFKNGIGAAAVMYINKTESQSLKYHLGPSAKHMVYEGELVGLVLAFQLLLSFPL